MQMDWRLYIVNICRINRQLNNLGYEQTQILRVIMVMLLFGVSLTQP